MAVEPLLPAEAALLVEPKASSGAKCLQAALLTLLSRDHLAVEEEGRFFKTRYLRLRAGGGSDLPRHLASIPVGPCVHCRKALASATAITFTTCLHPR